ncbi:hypothetical protein L204_105787 [Cryptococcus depauperatus]|nr:hypothetical protein L204_06051 [Cryptococcus depauperatus CBS 7855]
MLAAYLVAGLAAANAALAGVYITNPTTSTNAVGGEVLEVKWADDGKDPSVASVGQCSVDIYTGSMNNQIKLQNLAASVDVSKASSVSATINPAIGKDDSHYFVRFTALNFKDAKNPQYPYEAFSAMFSIKKMTGNFNSTVLAAIDAGSPSGATPSASNTSGSKSENGSKTSNTHTASPSPKKPSSALIQAAPASLALAFVCVASYLFI